MLKKHQLYDKLKQDIQLQYWLPGTVLTQQRLAEYYQVSRIVVRDALQALLNEGWLNSHGKAGIQVATFTAAEAEELCLLRLQLEPLALRLAAPALSFALLGQAEDVLVATKGAPPMPAYQRGELNWQFHRLLYQSCNKPHLMRLLDKLHQQVARYLGFQEQALVNANTSADQHQQLILLLRKGHTDAACELLTEHIVSASAQLVQYLQNK
jgi:DNA-binding GntR family transcriptional regulator